VVKKAALVAARRDRAAVAIQDLAEAIHRVVTGLEKKSGRGLYGI